MDTAETSTRSRGKGSLVVGFFLVGLGVWFFLHNLGFDLPHLGDLWPLFPALGGLAFLVSFVTGKGKDPGLVWPGTAGLLVGLFFFAFTLGPLEWWQMESYWPAFPLIGGLAFVATWVAGKLREPGLLVPGGIGLVAGVVGFSLTLGWFEWWLLPLVENGWPLALVALGAFMVIRGLLAARRA